MSIKSKIIAKLVLFIVSVICCLLINEVYYSLNSNFSIFSLLVLIIIVVNLLLCIIGLLIKNKLQDILIFQFGILISFGIFEITLRLFPLVYPKIFISELPIGMEKDVVHSLYNNKKTRWSGTGWLHHRFPNYKHPLYPNLKYDKFGFRNPYVKSEHDIILLGDSIIEAAASKKDLCFYFRAKNISCQNLAIGSSTIPHYNESFKLFAKSNEQTKLLLFIFGGNDFQDIPTFFKNRANNLEMPDIHYRYKEPQLCKEWIWRSYSTNLICNLVYNGEKLDYSSGLKKVEIKYSRKVNVAGKEILFNPNVRPAKCRPAPPNYYGEFGVKYTLPDNFFNKYVSSLLDKEVTGHPINSLSVFYIPSIYSIYSHFYQPETPGYVDIKWFAYCDRLWISYIQKKLSNIPNLSFHDTTPAFLNALKSNFIFVSDTDHHLNDIGTYTLYQFVEKHLTDAEEKKQL